MNCTEIENIYYQVSTHITEGTNIFWIIFSSMAALTSFILLVAGELYAKPTITLISGFIGLYLGFMLAFFIDNVMCEIRLGIVAIFILVFAVIGSCLMKKGFFLLGAASFGLAGHYIYEVLPFGQFQVPFEFQGKNGIYWFVLGGSSVAGSIISYLMKKDFLRIGTSFLGAAGASATTYVVFKYTMEPSVELSSVVMISIFAGSSALGIVSQYYLAKRRKRRKEEKKSFK